MRHLKRKSTQRNRIVRWDNTNLKLFASLTISISQSFCSLCSLTAETDVYLTKKDIKHQHSCMTAFTKKPKIHWTTSCSRIEILAKQISGCTDKRKRREHLWGLRRQEMCEMGVWQAGLEESCEDGEKEAAITMMMVIWLSAWKSFLQLPAIRLQTTAVEHNVSQCNEKN